MKPGNEAARGDAPPESERLSPEEGTGLPWPHSWRGVYLLVFSCFVLWVTLLYALTAAYR
jgi:hypothetical protein